MEDFIRQIAASLFVFVNFGIGYLVARFSNRRREDLTDTGGSSDDYAGNGGVISAFRACLVRV